MIKVYLAGRYSRRQELCEYARTLREMGFEVTSRWLSGDHELDGRGLSVQAIPAERARFAREDWEDVTSADWCISFTEEPRAEKSRGGRHVEFGAALALGLRCVVIGPRENVFHHLPSVVVHPTWDSWLATIAARTGEAD